MKYRVIFFSGSRAEFGLSENLIKLLSNSKKIKCDLIIGGSHCIEKYGNTSSNTIPIALEELLPSLESGNLIGLTAFGGGFTFGAAVIEKL